MFSQVKEVRASEKAKASANIVGSNSTIKGEFSSNGSIRIEGVLIGDVTTRSKLVMSDKALVKGNILADRAEIAGRVEGEIKVKDTLILHEKAVIEGNIFTKRLVVELGATFNGSCKMGDFLPDIELKEERHVVAESLQEERLS